MIERDSPRLWPYFVAIGVLAASLAVSVALLIDNYATSERLKVALRVSSERVTVQSKELTEYRLQYQPKDFATSDELAQWVSLKNFPKYTPADLDRAKNIQDRALKDGRVIGVEVITNSVTKVTEFWPVAVIGSEVWCIEPQTNWVTRFYPSDWWR